MADQPLPILYSFRRCPYAMRTRLALYSSGQKSELREVILRDKPDEMIAASPKATVPVMVNPDGSVIDESIDIMHWALGKNDPDNWLQPDSGTREEMDALIARFDGPFKTHLDRYKYSSRYAVDGNEAEITSTTNRDAAMTYLIELESRLQTNKYLFGRRFSLADAAIAPFVRQYANTNAAWFAQQDIAAVQNWLNRFLESDIFNACMNKYPQWKNSEPGVNFPEPS